MAEEPQPSNIQEGDDTPALPANAEDRKAAAALSSLDSRGDDEPSEKKGVDTEALGKAMKNLNVKESKKVEEKKVKIDQEDVALLIEQLELSKPKATDLLKQYDGDAVKAMSAFITSTA